MPETTTEIDWCLQPGALLSGVDSHGPVEVIAYSRVGGTVAYNIVYRRGDGTTGIFVADDKTANVAILNHADDVTKLSRIATQLANDIVAHLASIGGANVEVSIEVKADIPNGIGEPLQERLRKNAAAHQFSEPEFNP